MKMANNATVLTSFNTKKNSDFIIEVVSSLYDLLMGLRRGRNSGNGRGN